MKKSLLFISAFFMSAAASNAQITITSADVASPVKVIRQATDTMPTGYTIGSAGASQTWNMATLANGGEDTLTFVTASWGPDAASYPSANLAVKQGWQNFYAYATSNSSTLTIVGTAGNADFGTGPVQIKQYNSPGEIIMNFPATYMTTFTNNFTTTTPAFDAGLSGSGIDSVKMKSEVKKTVLVDAWGTLATPLGTFNVLRTKETKISHDTTSVLFTGFGWDPFPGTPQTGADSTTSYSWWANGVGFPLVSITLDSAGAMSQVQWLVVTPTAGINEASASIDMNLYPNPAQNSITFELDAEKVSAIGLFDVTGQLVGAQEVKGDKTTVDVSGLANGVYSYALIGKNKSFMNRGKFTVAK
jgi:hypothetical protein